MSANPPFIPLSQAGQNKVRFSIEIMSQDSCKSEQGPGDEHYDDYLSQYSNDNHSPQDSTDYQKVLPNYRGNIISLNFHYS